MKLSRNLTAFCGRVRSSWCAILAFGCALALTSDVAGAMATPTEEIEALLRFVAALDGASFVRNGDAHTPKEAEAHLRLKWGQQKKDIRTAEDFIRLCATKSSISGKPYSIKFKDGREEESASVLAKQLAALRAANAPPH